MEYTASKLFQRFILLLSSSCFFPAYNHVSCFYSSCFINSILSLLTSGSSPWLSISCGKFSNFGIYFLRLLLRSSRSLTMLAISSGQINSFYIYCTSSRWNYINWSLLGPSLIIFRTVILLFMSFINVSLIFTTAWISSYSSSSSRCYSISQWRYAWCYCTRICCEITIRDQFLTSEISISTIILNNTLIQYSITDVLCCCFSKLF